MLSCNKSGPVKRFWELLKEMILEAVTSCRRRSSKLSQAASSCRRGFGELFWDWFVARELHVLRYHYSEVISKITEVCQILGLLFSKVKVICTF
jgi:hypothetical protein